jgi:glutaredoxin
MKTWVQIAVIISLFFGIMAVIAYADGAEISYPQAYAAYQEGQPLVVVCSASWCPACHALVSELRASDVAFAILDVDHPSSDEIKTIYTGGSIPQTVVWIPKRRFNPLRRIGNIGLAGVRALLTNRE